MGVTKNVIKSPTTNCHLVPYVLSSVKPFFISPAKNKSTFQLMYNTNGQMISRTIWLIDSALIGKSISVKNLSRHHHIAQPDTRHATNAAGGGWRGASGVELSILFIFLYSVTNPLILRVQLGRYFFNCRVTRHLISTSPQKHGRPAETKPNSTIWAQREKNGLHPARP